MTKDKVINFLQQHLWWMLLLFIVILQIPFLEADPNINLSHSRDAHSDEGLNTIQLRNYINHGYLSAWECDNLMKNPFFNLVLYLPFKIFGTKLLVGRLTVLGFTLISLLIIGSKKAWRSWLMWMIPLVFLQFHIFQYMHFSLAEMMAVSCILLGMFGFVNMWDEANQREKLRYLGLGWIFLMLSWYTKIQFIYVIGVAGIYILIFIIHQIVTQKTLSANTMWVVVFSILIPMAMTYFYYEFWYKEYKDAFEYIMKNQTGNRFPPAKYFWGVIGENLGRYFTTPFVKPVWIGFLVSLPLGIYAWIKSDLIIFKRILLFTLIWFLVELHKIEIQHVPSRYLMSGYVAMLCFIATAMFGIWSLKDGKPLKIIQVASLIGVFLLVGMHIYNYSEALVTRTYRIKTINEYMSRYDNRSMVVIGPWAPTITWNTHMRTLPVWKDFLNDEHIQMIYNPDIVVSEPNEADSDGAFSADNFDIVNESDSVKRISIGKWPVNIYWMKKHDN